MKIKKYSLVFLVLVLAGLLSGCTGGTLANSWPGMASDGNVTYLADASFIYAVNADGSMTWRYPESADRNKTFYAAPTVSKGQVFAGGYNNVFYALDQQTGKENWAFTEAKDRFIGKPLAVESADLVLAPNADHTLYALTSAGKLQWKLTTGDPVWAQPVNSGDRIFVASMDGFIYGLNAADGSQLWSTDLGAAVVYSLAISEDGKHLYAGTMGKEMVALNSDTGTVAWRYTAPGNIWGRAILKDDVLYFGDQSGAITALSAESGAKRWEYPAGSPVIASGAFLGEEGIMFPAEKGEVVAVDYQGTKLWSQPINGTLYSNPVQIGDRVVVAVTQGTDSLLLVAYNQNGTQAWTFVQPK